MPKCREIMTPDPVCCEPGDSVAFVAQTMKQEDVGSVPVVASRDSGQLVGIVTDRDLVIKVLAGDRPSGAATVRDAMTAPPLSCRVDDDVDEVVRAMADRQVRRMPVVDADGRLAGIIAQADVATRVHEDRKTGELVEAISEPGTERR